MSALQLRVSNPNNELVISDNARGLCCVGRATLQQITQPYGSLALGGGGRYMGYSTYRIYHPNPIVWALDLPNNGTLASVLALRQPAAGVWDIDVYAGNAGSDTGSGFFSQYELAVWAFSWFDTVGDPRIGALYDQNMALKWDFSRRNPLFPKAFGLVNGNGDPVSLPALNRPVVLGSTMGWRNTIGYGTGGKNRYTNNYIRVWQSSTGQIRTTEVSKFASLTGGVDDGTVGDQYSPSEQFILIEGQDLP